MVISHLAQWPSWVLDMRSVGGQAYAVLTVCRGMTTLRRRPDVSKREAAADGIECLPEWAPLIECAQDWRYAGGSDEDADRYTDVVAFVRTVVPTVLTVPIDPSSPRRNRGAYKRAASPLSGRILPLAPTGGGEGYLFRRPRRKGDRLRPGAVPRPHNDQDCRERLFPSGSWNQATRAPPGAVQIPRSSWTMPS